MSNVKITGRVGSFRALEDIEYDKFTILKGDIIQCALVPNKLYPGGIWYGWHFEKYGYFKELHKSKSRC